MMHLILLATVALSSTLVAGYSSQDFNLSNPVHKDYACTKLYPNHSGLELKTTGSPFSIQTNVQGNSVQVTISSSGPGFKGFIIQAKGPKGSFAKNDSVYIVPCDQATVRHRNAFTDVPKTTSFTVTWTADQSHGSVKFEGAVVQQYKDFYKLDPKTVNF